MPQMAPLNWLTLMIFFSMILIMFNILNFYSFNYTHSSFKISKKMKSINWKW